MKRRRPPLLIAALLLAACADLTAPTSDGKSDAPTAPTPPPSAPAAAEPAARRDPPPAPPPGAEENITAAHILIAYQGARRAKATRSKEEAAQLAAQVAGQAKQGADFAELAKKHSDDPVSGSRGGTLGSFPRQAMIKPFSDAAAALKPGQISGVVETPFGFHIIKRM